MLKKMITVGALCVAAQTNSFADFQFQEKTQVTGGSALGAMKMAGVFSKQARQATDPIVSSVYVKGNKMARVSAQSTEIIDLDAETITTIDHGKKQYTVMTFAQMKQQMERAAAKMKEEQAKQAAKSPDKPAEAKLEFEAKVRETGATKEIAGMTARESILNLAMKATSTKTNESGSMAITNDMWMVEDVPGYSEVRDFYMRYAMKMGTMVGETFRQSMAAMPSGIGEGTAELVKEMSKLKGMPVAQVMRVGMTANGEPLPAASEAPLKSGDSAAMPSGNDIAKSAGTAAATSAISSRMKGLGGLAAGGLGGGFGGFGKKKEKAEAPKEAAAADGEKEKAPSAGAAYGVLMETSSEMSGFSTAGIEASKFETPAGYKEMALSGK